MKSHKLCPALLLLACTTVSYAARRHPVETGTVLLASAAADPSVPPMHVGTASSEARPQSAGVVEALPDMPRGSAMLAAMFHILPMPLQAPAPVSHESFMGVLPDGPRIGLLESSPLAGAARRMRSQNFNTEDGSLVDAFAICYRLNSRSSLQVIPGDPAPVKMAVTTMANNTGVTVGMVVRLSKQR